MLAASLGGIKTQLAVIAGLAIGQHLRETKRIRELEEKKKGLLEVVGL
jgi:hypothetical protein